MENLNQKLEECKIQLTNEEVAGQEEEYGSLEEYFLDCCRFGEIEEIKQCILDNVDITWFDKYLNNAIHMASANGHINVLDILFD